jgi:ribosome modulation factor
MFPGNLSPAVRTPEDGELLGLAEKWARAGRAHAAWWLGWIHSGSNHAKSVWYYIAAIRRDPGSHGWALERVISDAFSAIMCKGVHLPSLIFLREITELSSQISHDWKGAIHSAETAEHLPVTAEQLEIALEYAMKRAQAERSLDRGWWPSSVLRHAAWHAGVPTQALHRFPKWQDWIDEETSWKQAFDQRLHAASDTGREAGFEGASAEQCPYISGSRESEEWNGARDEIVKSLHGIARSDWERRLRVAVMAEVEASQAETAVNALLEFWKSDHCDWRITLPEDASAPFEMSF